MTIPAKLLIHRLQRKFSRLAREGNQEELQATGRVVVGLGTYGDPEIRSFAHDSTRLIIGRFSSIGPGVLFLLGGNHPVDRATTFPIRERYGLEGAGEDGFPSSRGDIHVGNDVWVGSRVVVVSGARIGDGAVVAAGSVVTGQIPPFSISAGTPARVLRFRFSPEHIEALQRLRWWDWSEEQVQAHADLLSSPVDDQVLQQLFEVVKRD